MSKEDRGVLSPVPEGIHLLGEDDLSRVIDKHPAFYLPVNHGRDPESKCVTCGGHGEFRWYHPDTDNEGKIITYRCDCIGQWVLYAAFLHANLGLWYQRLRWRDARGIMENRATKETAGVVAKYLEDAEDQIWAGRGFFLYGLPGTGKTYLATLMLKDLISKGFDCYQTTMEGMLDNYTSTFRDNVEGIWFARRIKNVRILLIDEIGKESDREAKITRPLLDDVIRHRVASGIPTIMVSNLDQDKIAERYGESIIGLLRESSASHRFEGIDYRLFSEGKRQEREVLLHLRRPICVG